jgi:hypothetical protein
MTTGAESAQKIERVSSMNFYNRNVKNSQYKYSVNAVKIKTSLIFTLVIIGICSIGTLTPASAQDNSSVRLSQKLKDLSVYVSEAEKSIDAFAKETAEKRDAKISDLKTSAKTAKSEFEAKIQSLDDKVTSSWSKVNEYFYEHVEGAKAAVSEKKDEVELSYAEARAKHLADNAAASIAFALSTIREAELAVAEALDAELHVEALKAK